MMHDNQTDFTTLCAVPPLLHQTIVTVSIVVLCASILAAVFDILIIYCAVRIFKRHWVFTHIFIASMTLADLIPTMYSYPVGSLQQIFPYLQSVNLCASRQLTVWLGQALSCLFLTAINGDRLLFFHYPLKYVLLSNAYAISICTAIVMVSFGAVAGLWISKAAYVTNTCTTMLANKGLYLALIDVTFLLPVISSFMLSSYLFIVTERRRAARPSGGSKRKVGALLFVFTTSLWTLVAMLPNRAYLTWRFGVYVHGAHPTCPDDFVLWLGYATNLLMTAYPMINPFITLFICAPYKRELNRLFAQAKSTVLCMRQ